MERAATPADGAGDLTRVATYERSLPVGMARVWENVFDWEHLPWLHRTSFLDIEALDSGAHGWRARVGLPPAARRQEIEIELRVEREAGRYVTRTLAGPGSGGEIWTRLFERGPHAVDIEVAFHARDVAPEQVDAVGAAFVTLYRRLWDEDEAMMARRAELLARTPPPRREAAELALGPLDALRPRLPLGVTLGGRHLRVVEAGGALHAYETVCPHWLGPLGEAPVEDGSVRCPWHGYRFDLASGTCAERPRLCLRRAEVRVAPDGEVRLLLAPGG